MEEFRKVYRSLFVGIPIDTGVQRVAKALKQSGYEMGFKGTTFILYQDTEGTARPGVGDYEIVDHVDGPAILITADINIPEGKSLAALLEKLDDVSKLAD